MPLTSVNSLSETCELAAYNSSTNILGSFAPYIVRMECFTRLGARVRASLFIGTKSEECCMIVETREINAS